jgi:hypothetical protein
MPNGTSSMLSFSWWRTERTNSWRTGTCSLICCWTLGFASAWWGGSGRGQWKSVQIVIGKI